MGQVLGGGPEFGKRAMAFFKDFAARLDEEPVLGPVRFKTAAPYNHGL